jgi:hypothetical protein
MLLPRGKSGDETGNELAFLVGVDSAELRGELKAGERFAAQTRVVARYGSLVKVQGRLLQDQDVRAEAELSFATRV